MTRLPRSLLDRVDLAAVRVAAAARSGEGAVVVSCLVEGGAVAWAADDPAWPDRDRIVVSSATLAALFAGTPDMPSPEVVPRGRALATAAGMAAVAAAEGAVFRVFCLLDEPALEDGALWESARAARAGTLVTIVVASTETARRAGGLFAAAGWRVAEALADDPVQVLCGLDRVQHEGGSVPGALLAVTR